MNSHTLKYRLASIFDTGSGSSKPKPRSSSNSRSLRYRFASFFDTGSGTGKSKPKPSGNSRSLRYRFASFFDTSSEDRPSSEQSDKGGKVAQIATTVALLAIVSAGTIAGAITLNRMGPSITPPWESNEAVAYSGRIVEDGIGVDGNCDIQFSLHSSRYGGYQIGDTVEKEVTLQTGQFTALLDFGVDGERIGNPYMEVQARCPAGVGEHKPIVRERLNRRKPLELNSYRELVDATFGPVEPLSQDIDNRDELIALSKATAPVFKHEDDPRHYDWNAASIVKLNDGNPPGRGAKAVSEKTGHQREKRMVNLMEPERQPNSHGFRRATGQKGLGGLRFSKINKENRRNSRPEPVQSTSILATSITH